jgi:hypothetical protein
VVEEEEEGEEGEGEEGGRVCVCVCVSVFVVERREGRGERDFFSSAFCGGGKKGREAIEAYDFFSPFSSSSSFSSCAGGGAGGGVCVCVCVCISATGMSSPFILATPPWPACSNTSKALYKLCVCERERE